MSQKKERIGLIIPGSIFLNNERNFIHLGILRCAAALEALGYEIDMLDLCGVKNYEQAAKDYINSTDTKTIGITGTSPQMPQVDRICTALREERSDLKLILGGPHPTVVNAARKKEKKKGIESRAHVAFNRLYEIVDVVVAGDGEDSIETAIYSPKGTLVDADDPDSRMFLTKSRLSELPLPSRHLVDMQSYKYYIDGESSTSLIMQLGCAMACRFCSGRLSPTYRRVRIRAIDSVLNEIRHLHEVYGYKSFQLYDDELNLSPSMIPDLKAIIKLQEQLGVSFKFRGFIKSHLFNREQAKYLKECGFSQICIGFETGSDRILQNIKKQASKKQNSECVEIAKEAGLKIKAFMSLGHPHESDQTVKDTCEWLINMEVEEFDCSVVSPFPGCPYYDESTPFDPKNGIWRYQVPENGDNLYSVDVDYVKTTQYYKGDRNLGYSSFVYTDFLKAEEVVKARDWIEDTVRQKLNLPYFQTAAAINYDHSMGTLPPHILRSSLVRPDSLRVS